MGGSNSHRSSPYSYDWKTRDFVWDPYMNRYSPEVFHITRFFDHGLQFRGFFVKFLGCSIMEVYQSLKNSIETTSLERVSPLKKGIH